MKQSVKRIWHLSLLAAAVGVTMTSDGVGATVSETDSYERFLYLRHNPEGSTAKTTSLVLVRVTRDGFESRDVYSENNLPIGWRPLGVCNGKLYAIKIDTLMTVDLETGAAAELDRWIDSCTWRDHRLYVSVREEPSSLTCLLRVYDTETETYRDIASDPQLSRNGYMSWQPPRLEVSPDHKWLTYFFPSNRFDFRPAYYLRRVAVDDGSITASEVSVAATTFSTGAGPRAYGPPFHWLDSKALLVVDALESRSVFPEEKVPEMVLARVDIDADRITNLCRLPPFEQRIGDPFFRNVTKSEVPRLVLGRLGQYRIDLAERRLVRDAEFGDGYSYTQGGSRNTPDELRFRNKLLESEMIIPQVAASPDGRRVAWHARTVSQFSDAHASNIRFHDAASGETRTVAPECWIPEVWDTRGQSSLEGNLLWVSTRDLTPRSPTNQPAGWKRLSPQPHRARR